MSAQDIDARLRAFLDELACIIAKDVIEECVRGRSEEQEPEPADSPGERRLKNVPPRQP